MKVGIVTTQIPFVRRSTDVLAERMRAELEVNGHRVEHIRIPFQWAPPQKVLEHLIACRLLRLDSGEPDLLFAMDFPAYIAPFPHKKLWLVSPFETPYDPLAPRFQNVPATPEELRVRKMALNASNHYLTEATAVYTGSRRTADRLKISNDMDGDGILYPPLRQPDLFHVGEARDYFFLLGDFTDSRRQSLTIEALRLVKSPYKIVVAGASGIPSLSERLGKLLRKYGLSDRVKFVGSDSEQLRAEHIAHCLAVLDLDREESFDSVVLEAYHSHKPVVSIHNAGGYRELIEHGRNGLVIAPTAVALASAMEELWNAPHHARAMGEEANQTLERFGISWSHVLERLLS
jgi:glycosyltransferase involved in cell wall biosynthesis